MNNLKFEVKIEKIYYLPETCTFRGNTFTLYSRNIVAHFHVILFLPACHNIANGIKPGSD